MSEQVPLDTLGHPLPPPVPSNTICKIPKREWRQWWVKYHTNTLPEERGCCVCGYSFEARQLTALDTDLVHSNVQRQYLNGMMTKDLFLCNSCRRKCDRCSAIVPEAQKKLFKGLCQKCNVASGAKKPKKHRPSGR